MPPPSTKLIMRRMPTPTQTHSPPRWPSEMCKSVTPLTQSQGCCLLGQGWCSGPGLRRRGGAQWCDGGRYTVSRGADQRSVPWSLASFISCLRRWLTSDCT
ncbi:hypothetical protein J4Q44_G00232860 [Coregonus suidteri]|uniref:Uncharacterized protein n=1 Tax=Coregonus suidteri TaxID=861788 RepID=A0AAN8LR70_9TELE